MKKNGVVRIIIPLALILGLSIAFLAAMMSVQLGNATVSEVALAAENYTINLWIEGMDGESKQDGRVGSIEVIAYSHSVMNSYEPTITRGAAVIQHTPLRIVKNIDKTTPKLYEACCITSTIPIVTLRFYSEPTSLNYLTIELTGATIVSIFTYGITTSGNLPVETISFTYEVIKWTYTEFDSTGSPKGNVEYQATWGG
ncbi:MAG: Hcp family type VI secretion system effector [Candidatus Hodarchaeales archaeon]|jgi:type VI secretion system Hcp family effector